MKFFLSHFLLIYILRRVKFNKWKNKYFINFSIFLYMRVFTVFTKKKENKHKENKTLLVWWFDVIYYTIGSIQGIIKLTLFFFCFWYISWLFCLMFKHYFIYDLICENMCITMKICFLYLKECGGNTRKLLISFTFMEKCETNFSLNYWNEPNVNYDVLHNYQLILIYVWGVLGD